MSTKRKFTVVLLYPDYMADDYGTDLYVAHVEADTPEQSVPLAQAQAAEYQEEFDGDPADFAMILVFEGHILPVLDGYSAL
jgi:hypothetical protein